MYPTQTQNSRSVRLSQEKEEAFAIRVVNRNM